jgi:ABC-2 type transport system ATP-binding protein
MDEVEKLTDHIVVMAKGRIAAIGSVAQIRDRLNDVPLTIGIDLRPRSEAHGMRSEGREIAAMLLKLQDVNGVEIVETATETDTIRVLVRARNPQRFFREFGRLVLEEWFDVVRLETLDDSAEAVLGYLLGAKG